MERRNGAQNVIRAARNQVADGTIWTKTQGSMTSRHEAFLRQAARSAPLQPITQRKLAPIFPTTPKSQRIAASKNKNNSGILPPVVAEEAGGKKKKRSVPADTIIDTRTGKPKPAWAVASSAPLNMDGSIVVLPLPPIKTKWNRTAKGKLNTNNKTRAEISAVAPRAAMNIEVPKKQQCMELFQRMDPNGNGMLSLAELDKGVVELWPHFNNKPAIMRAYHAADASGEGFVTRKEFEFFLRYLTYYNNLWADFDAIDTSDDRRIERHEFIANAGRFGVDNPEKAFDEMDANAGGFILFEEFCEWMVRNNPGWGDGDDSRAASRQSEVRAVHSSSSNGDMHACGSRTLTAESTNPVETDAIIAGGSSESLSAVTSGEQQPETDAAESADEAPTTQRHLHVAPPLAAAGVPPPLLTQSPFVTIIDHENSSEKSSSEKSSSERGAVPPKGLSLSLPTPPPPSRPRQEAQPQHQQHQQYQQHQHNGCPEPEPSLLTPVAVTPLQMYPLRGYCQGAKEVEKKNDDDDDEDDQLPDWI